MSTDLSKQNNQPVSYISVIKDPGQEISKDIVAQWIDDIQSMLNVYRPMSQDQIERGALLIATNYRKVIYFNDLQLMATLILQNKLVDIKDRFDINLISKAINKHLENKKNTSVPKPPEKKDIQTKEQRDALNKKISSLLAKMNNNVQFSQKVGPIIDSSLRRATEELLCSVAGIDYGEYKEQKTPVGGMSDDEFKSYKLKKLRHSARNSLRSDSAKRTFIQGLLNEGRITEDFDPIENVILYDKEIVSDVLSGEIKSMIVVDNVNAWRYGVVAMFVSDSIAVATAMVSKIRMLTVDSSSIQVENDIGEIVLINQPEELDLYSQQYNHKSFSHFLKSYPPMGNYKIISWRKIKWA